ncbi:uncharacterized protein BP5553_06669 [Venustampulla echinocandica]|uniref:CENP-T/Histone H4 histone fold domain-containing protein n=1 Tax=Venustampulla echinocandica TaxID=2656787 RepID=A0A370TKM5_9HELO|nr:uncharacterized protein BP5553_06669 [Venustampulla echinocandica]RDL36057.1 hypothetical protein BP5553_06669 [Venustampulla echinocandica]
MSAEPDNRNATGRNNNRLPRRSFRVTPLDVGNSTSDSTETPYKTLRRLANMPKPTTPVHRASSAGPPSTHNSLRRTPGAQPRTPGIPQRIGGSGRKTYAVTPHGRAARRELEARRAGLTPGKDRRKSGLQQRETPRDALRALSRLLAPTSLPIIPTPTDPEPSTERFKLPEQDDFDDGLELERPRLSLPLGDEDDDDDDDDSLFLPPRSAGLEDENFTVQSVEFARRAISERPPGRLSRGSFGSIRLSDRFADLSELGLEGSPGDANASTFVGGDFEGDNEEVGDMTGLPGDNSVTLGDLGFDRGMASLTPGRNSDIRPATLPGDENEATFVFTVPPRDVSEQPSPGVADLPDSDIIDGDEPTYEMDGSGEEGPRSPSSAPGIDLDASLQDPTMEEDLNIASAEHRGSVRRKQFKVSKHGIKYPSLPAGVVKKLATSFARTGGNSKAKISKETLEFIMQASDWFFEQVSDDLGAYAKHAGRKTIDESDVITLMGRQRQTHAGTTPFSLAQKHLPRELLQDLRMVPPSKLKKGRQLQTVEEED